MTIQDEIEIDSRSDQDRLEIGARSAQDRFDIDSTSVQIDSKWIEVLDLMCASVLLFFDSYIRTFKKADETLKVKKSIRKW